MLLNWILVISGLAALILGAEALVRGASGMALMARLTPAVVGLTVVAAGTSMPELMVSAKASLTGNTGLAMGNVVGSNILNIGLVLGVTALVRPLTIRGNTMRLEWPVLMLSTLILFLLARDGVLDRTEGGFLFAAMILFMAYSVWLDRQGAVPEHTGSPPATASFGRTGITAGLLNAGAAVVGIAMLAQGAVFLVRGAVGIAGGLGISETIIGLTIVAVGTSAPELVTSVVAALRGRGDLAIGNIIGSSMFNILGILGVASVLHPMAVPDEMLQRDLRWLIGVTALMFPLMITGKKVVRVEGIVLSAVFIGYLAILIIGR